LEVNEKEVIPRQHPPNIQNLVIYEKIPTIKVEHLNSLIEENKQRFIGI